MRTALWLSLIVLPTLACNRPGAPSPEYAQAREKWSALIQEKLQDAPADPRAQEVLALLAQVSPKSVDGPAAAELKAEIEAGRKEASEQEAAQARREAEVQESLVRAAASAPSGPAEPAEPAVAEAPAAAAPDAGAVDSQPTEGMTAADFKSKFARCFEFKSPALVSGVNGGEVWGLKDLLVCRQLHPTFTTRSALLFDGKLSAIRPSSELAPKKFKVVDGKLVQAE